MKKVEVPLPLLLLSITYVAFSIYLLFQKGGSEIFFVAAILAWVCGLFSRVEGALIFLKAIVFLQILTAALVLMFTIVFGTDNHLHEQFQKQSALDSPTALAIATFFAAVFIQSYVAFSQSTNKYFERS